MIIAIFFLFFVAIIIASNRNNYAKLTKHQKLFRFGLSLLFGGLMIFIHMVLLNYMMRGTPIFSTVTVILAIIAVTGAVVAVRNYDKN